MLQYNTNQIYNVHTVTLKCEFEARMCYDSHCSANQSPLMW